MSRFEARLGKVLRRVGGEFRRLALGVARLREDMSVPRIVLHGDRSPFLPQGWPLRPAI